MNSLTQIRYVTIFTLMLASACSSTRMSQQAAAVASSNVATVYFFRTHYSSGGAVGVDIKDNGIDIGTLQDGTYFIYHANPGQHVFTATTDTSSTQSFTFQAGATYYVKASVVRSQDLFQPSLAVVYYLQGQAAIQNLNRLNYQE